MSNRDSRQAITLPTAEGRGIAGAKSADQQGYERPVKRVGCRLASIVCGSSSIVKNCRHAALRVSLIQPGSRRDKLSKIVPVGCGQIALLNTLRQNEIRLSPRWGVNALSPI